MIKHLSFSALLLSIFSLSGAHSIDEETSQCDWFYERVKNVPAESAHLEERIAWADLVIQSVNKADLLDGTEFHNTLLAQIAAIDMAVCERLTKIEKILYRPSRIVALYAPFIPAVMLDGYLRFPKPVFSLAWYAVATGYLICLCIQTDRYHRFINAVASWNKAARR